MPNALSLGAYISWGLSHHAEYTAIYEAGQKIMSDFPGFGDTVPFARLGHAPQRHAPILTPEDEKLKAAIEALDDKEEITADHPIMAMIAPSKVVRGRIFGPRPPAPVDPATGQPVPRQPRFDGTFLKFLLQNLPTLLTQLPAIIDMIKNLFPAQPPATT